MAYAHTDTPRYLGDVLTRGSVVAGYRIERVLGTGRMGTIYLVQNPDLPRNHSLKVLNTEHLHDRELRTRFVREADMAAQLNHPNIVTVYRRGTTDDGLLWIAMEYVDGTDAEALLRQGLVTPARAVHIVAEIAKALDYAHRNNVIHRDVKPANFLVSTASHNARRVLLADFGIAHSLGHDQPPTSGSLLATVAYAAPEVFNGAPVDGQADLYSVGCSLFRLLTRRAPFPNPGDTATVIKSHLHDPPPKVTDFATDLPAALDDVIATALAKNPAHRFQSGTDLAAAAASALQQPRRSPRQPRSTPADYHERSPHAAPPADRQVAPPAPEPALRFDPAVFAAMSLRARRSQHRRRRIALICTLVAGLATLAGAVFWVSQPAGLDNSSDGPTTAPAAQTVSPSIGTNTERRLRRMLPAGYAPDSCNTVASSNGAVAAMECSANSDPGGPPTARYLLMPNTETLRSTFDATVDDISVVNCPGNIQSPGAWHRNATPQLSSGTVVCGTRRGTSIVAWTTDAQSLLSVAQSATDGPTLDQLYAWWFMHS
jgi:serine/threonine-protein kinase